MQILGVQFDGPEVRCAILEVKGKKPSILALKSFANVPEFKGRIATGIDSIVRSLDFQISSIKQIEKCLPFQIENLTHIPLEELTFASTITPLQQGASSTIFLLPKETLNLFLDRCHSLQIVPDLVTASPQALLRFAQFRCPDLESAFLIDLGSNEWTCVFMEQRKIKHSFTIPKGNEALLYSLWEDRKKVLLQKEVNEVAKQIDLLQLKPHLNPNLSKELADLKHQLNHVLFSFQQLGGVQPIFFTGRVDSFGHLCRYLLEESSELAHYESSASLPLEELKYAIAIGCALENSVKEAKRVQFLKEDFISKKAWKRAGIRGMGLSLLSFLLSIMVLVFGKYHFWGLKQEMAAIVMKYIGKSDEKLAGQLFEQGIEAGLNETFRTIQKHDKIPSYFLAAPTVSETLSWLTTHPLLNILQAGEDPLNIIDLKYQLVSFPRIGSTNTPYLAKVELFFSVKNPTSARKFHEALLQDSQFIDLSQEITWEAIPEGYKTSFHLKNKSSHVR